MHQSAARVDSRLNAAVNYLVTYQYASGSYIMHTLSAVRQFVQRMLVKPLPLRHSSVCSCMAPEYQPQTLVSSVGIIPSFVTLS